MRATLTNLLTLDPQNVLPGIFWLSAILWVVVVILSLFSVKAQNLNAMGTLFWSLLIIAVPLVGLFIYCLFCLTRVDYFFFEGFKLPFFSKSHDPKQLPLLK